MSSAFGILLVILTILGMEGVAYVAHRWVMHGFGWFLHESHHRPRTGNWELNDLYAVIFALPSITMLLGGVRASALVAGRRAEARNDEALRRADVFFLTSPAPHCQTNY